MARRPRGAPPPWGPAFRMGVPPPSVTAVAPDQRVTAPAYIGVSRLVGGQPAAYPLPTSNEYLLRYSEGVREGQMPELSPRSLISSSAGQAAARANAEGLLAEVRSYPDDEYRAAEPEHLEKALLQSGYCPGWQFIEGGLSRPEPAREGLDEEAALLGRYLSRFGRPASVLPHVSYPRGKFKGLPFLSRADAALAPAAAMAALVGTRDTAEEVMRYVGERLGDPSLYTLPLAAIGFTRTGPLGKAQPYFSFGGAEATMTYNVKGTFCRRRHVNAFPAFTNMACRFNAVAFKTWLRGAPAFHHVGRSLTEVQVRRARAKGLRVWSDDLSGYDKSVSRHHQEALFGLWRTVAPDPGAMPLYEWTALDAPTIYPGWNDADAQLIVYPKDAGIPSGHIGTSVDGSGINWMRVIKAVGRATGWGSERAERALGTDWELWIWGDDTLMALPPDFDADAYVAANEELGYKCKLSEAPVFLMTIYPTNGPATNLASRTYAQTVWREHEQLHFELTVFGLWVRFGLLRGHPLFDRAWARVVAAAEPDGRLRRLGIRTTGDLEVYVRTPAYQEALRRVLEANPAMAATLVDSLTRGSGDVEDNPDARFALALLGRVAVDTARWVPPGRLGLRPETQADGYRMLDAALDAYLRYIDEREADRRYGPASMLDREVVDDDSSEPVDSEE